MKKSTNTRLIIFLATLAFVLLGTYLVIRYAQGYRPRRSGIIEGTGLLSATSFPEGAEVYINGQLTTATDNTLNLTPGEYFIEIKMDGYHTWSKNLSIEEELVTSTNATLFPTVPTFSPLTFTGAINPTPDPDGSQLAFTVASASAATKNGLYVLELPSTPLNLNRSPRQITRNTGVYDFATASYVWSPDGSQILVEFNQNSHLLLDSTKFNDAASFVDVTVRLPQIFKEWEEELARIERAKLLDLPDFMMGVATESATNIYVSPDKEKMLYQATSDLTIPVELIPPLPSANTQPETRNLTKGNFYVYDIEEDKNFLVLETSVLDATPSSDLTKDTAEIPLIPEKILLIDDIAEPLPAELASSASAFRKLSSGYTADYTIELFNAQYSPIHVTDIQWFPDSYHLVVTTDTGIDIMEYDRTNRVTIYSGPFDRSFVYPWPNGSSLITLIQFSPDTPSNLYSIKLK